MKKIIFFNAFHSGDIHASREFVRDIKNKTINSIEYHHNCSPKILADINIEQKAITPQYGYNSAKILYETEELIYINTWYNPNTLNFGQNGGCTLKTLYANFQTVYQHLNIPIEPIEYYIPNIDFSKYEINKIDQFINLDFRKKVFISNGVFLSGQSVMFNFDPIINYLAINFPDILFIISNQTSVVNHNVINSANIIQEQENDLCENAYLMTHCDVIIGRCSGTFTIGLIKENLISNKKQTWVGVCSINPKFGIEEFLNENKKFYWLQIYEPNALALELQKIINEI